MNPAPSSIFQPFTFTFAPVVFIVKKPQVFSSVTLMPVSVNLLYERIVSSAAAVAAMHMLLTAVAFLARAVV